MYLNARDDEQFNVRRIIKNPETPGFSAESLRFCKMNLAKMRIYAKSYNKYLTKMKL